MDRETLIRDIARAICCPRGCAQEATGAPYCDASLCEAAARAALPIALEAAASLKFLMDLPSPEDGPFTIQTKAVDAYASAIRSLSRSNTDPEETQP